LTPLCQFLQGLWSLEFFFLPSVQLLICSLSWLTPLLFTTCWAFATTIYSEGALTGNRRQSGAVLSNRFPVPYPCRRYIYATLRRKEARDRPALGPNHSATCHWLKQNVGGGWPLNPHYLVALQVRGIDDVRFSVSLFRFFFFVSYLEGDSHSCDYNFRPPYSQGIKSQFDSRIPTHALACHHRPQISQNVMIQHGGSAQR